MKCIFYGDVLFFFTTKSILVNTYGNYVSDYTKEITQKKVLCFVKQKCLLKIQKNHVCCEIFFTPEMCALLAHLSQRLIGELIGYSLSGVRPSASSVVNNFKRLLLRNRWADQSQILCRASLGRGNDILFAASGSHDQDGRHAHIW